jgi:hypothetical protein
MTPRASPPFIFIHFVTKARVGLAPRGQAATVTVISKGLVGCARPTQSGPEAATNNVLGFIIGKGDELQRCGRAASIRRWGWWVPARLQRLKKLARIGQI